MKVFKRLTSAFLLILLILQTMLTPAYADWAASGGGHGNSGVMGSGGGGLRKLPSFSIVLDKETGIPQSRGVK